MAPASITYLPGASPPGGSPLERYLPRLPGGIAAAWLAQHAPPGSWVLDPFGTSPQFILEAARAGYRVLAAVNNPVTRFLVEMGAASYSQEAYRSALSELADARKGDERLEPFIQSFYLTVCAKCGQSIPAQAFVWKKQASAPQARIYTCPHCGDEGERPVDAPDLERLSQYSRSGLNRARAIERVVDLSDPNRQDVEDALDCYLPRPLLALFTLLNKLDGLSLPSDRKRMLTALALSACDSADALWPYPPAQTNPRQTAVPARFLENNLWMALEAAIPQWATAAPPAPVALWPEVADTPRGITLFQGRLKDLLPELGNVPLQGAAAVFPRPNQAFWTLAALWTGWLWGKEAVAPFKSVLNRRRYDWTWHTGALHTTLAHLNQGLPEGLPFFGVISGLETQFLSAALVAAEGAQLELRGLALREEDDLAQVEWVAGRQTAPSPAALPDLKEKAIPIIRDWLEQRGEPATLVTLHAAVLESLARDQALHAASLPPDDTYAQVQNSLKNLFADHSLWQPFDPAEHGPAHELFWLPRLVPPPTFSLADQVEVNLVRFLQKNPGARLADIDAELCRSLPGLQTPSLELVRVCLSSYGEQIISGKGRWRLRHEDEPQHRKADLFEMHTLLSQMGARLGFKTEGELPHVWLGPDELPAYIFYVLASSTAGRYIYHNNYPAQQSLLVIPGGRANLLAYKLRADPLLQQEIARGWRMVKFRQLRKVNALSDLTVGNWLVHLEGDLPEYEGVQMRLFE